MYETIDLSFTRDEFLCSATWLFTPDKWRYCVIQYAIEHAEIKEAKKLIICIYELFP